MGGKYPTISSGNPHIRDPLGLGNLGEVHDPWELQVFLTRLRRWGASGAGGSGARSGDASKRRTDRRGHRPGVSALEFDIHLSRVYPPPFFLKHFFLTVFFSVLIYFCFPFPTKSGRPFGEIALLLPPKITSDSGNGQRRKRVARAPKRSEGRERDRVRERALTSETREGQGQSE